MKVLASAPCRISLFGGGTDCEPFASLYGGVVVSVAINLRQHIVLYTDDDREKLTEHDDKGIFPEHADTEFIYKMMNTYESTGTIHSTCDAHLGAGLGSSAAAAVAVITALKKERGDYFTLKEIAEEAWIFEQQMGWFGGKQDQYASALGGLNVMEFGADVRVTQFARSVPIDSILSSLVLFYTGERKKKHPQSGLREPTAAQIEALKQIKHMAVGAIGYIVKGDIEKMGKCLDINWEFKKASNPNVSSLTIERIYAQAKEAGAYGGKVLGAGSGGYMLFVVNPDQRESFLQRMEKHGLKNVDFSFDWNGVEARVV